LALTDVYAAAVSEVALSVESPANSLIENPCGDQGKRKARKQEKQDHSDSISAGTAEVACPGAVGGMGTSQLLMRDCEAPSSLGTRKVRAKNLPLKFHQRQCSPIQLPSLELRLSW
jgi:hypothetical protein